MRVIENVDFWQIFTDIDSNKQFAIFLVNSEDDEIPMNQTPFMNVPTLSYLDSRL